MIRGRQGFSLMETMVSVAVLVTVSAVVVPSLNDALGSMRISQAVSTLDGLEDAIKSFKTDVFRGSDGTNRYPGALGQLSQRPVAGVDGDLCGDKYNAGLASQWAGPYIQAIVPAGGLPISIGTMRNAFGFDSTTGKEMLLVYIDQVRLKDAAALNVMMDGDLDSNGAAPTAGNQSGRIRWNAATANDLVTVTFRTAGPNKC